MIKSRQKGLARRWRGGLVLLALFALAQLLPHAASAAALTPKGHYVFRSYGPAEGLVNTTVTQLLQDSHGFIWAGTDDGLYRYDGYRFDVFGTRQGLVTSEIEALFEDRRGTLWVGTHAGLSRWNGLAFAPVAGVVGPEDHVRALADDAAGLWLASSKGLLRAGPDLAFDTAPGWPGGEATALWIDPKASAVWAGRWDGRAHVLQFGPQGWSDVPLEDDNASERVDALAEDGDGRLWARSSTRLWRLDARGQRFESIALPASIASEPGYLSVGRRGDLWVSSNERLLHREGGRWTDILGGAVLGTRPVLEDREGSLWFGTRGLQRLAGRGVFHAYDVTEGLPGNVGWSVARAHDGSLWVGTEHGLTRAVGERFETVPGTEGWVVRSIAPAPDGKLYFAGIPAGEVLSFDPARGTLRRFAVGANAPGRIFHLLLDRDGMLWVTTDTGGLLRADTHEALLHFTREVLPGATPQEFLRGIDEAGGQLWVATHNGLLLRESGQWRRLGLADGLRSSEVEYVRVAHNGDVVVAYGGTRGFDRMRYEAGRLRTLSHVEFGTTRYIDGIFILGEDAQDNLWVGTGRGIDRYTPAGVEHFSAQQGLAGEDTASMSFLADPNGDVWFGVVGGLMRFDAAKSRALPPRVPPPAELVEVRLGEQRFAPASTQPHVPVAANAFHVRFASLGFAGDGAVQYKTLLDGLETTPAITESREARYSALPPGAYRFEVSARAGPSGAWGTPATFAFEVLPAWWQTWWVRALSALGLVFLLAAGVRWRLAALERRNRLLEQHIATRTAELSDTNRLLVSEIGERLRAESDVQQRNAELEELNRRLAGTQSQLLQSEKMASVGQLAAGVAHEINNPIGFVQSNLNSLSQYVADIFEVLRTYERLVESALPDNHAQRRALEELKARVDLEFLRRDTGDLLTETLEGVTRVRKIVKDLKDFSHIDEAEWQRIDLHQSLDSTLNVVAHELKYKADLVKEYGTLPAIECLPFQINQVFLNLLVNAVQAIEGRGTITIRTGCDGAFVWASIADTGKGIDPALLHRIFEPFFTTKPVGVGTGLGLSVSYGIVQKHGGSIDVQSVPGHGTTFTVRLPVEPRAETPGDAANEPELRRAAVG